MTRQASRGFTLIELLVVIAIIAILAAILFPVFARAREKARSTTCMSNQKQIALSVQMYVQDHDETMPDATTWTTDIARGYGMTGKIWDCPSTTLSGREGAADYFYVGGDGTFLSNVSLADITKPDVTPIIGDLAKGKTHAPYITHAKDCSDIFPQAMAAVDKRHAGGAIFAFADGHVELVKNVTAALFIPALIDRSKLSQPLMVVGQLLDKNIPWSDNSMRTNLLPYGITIAVGGASGTPLDRANNTCFTDGLTTSRSRFTRTSSSTPPGLIPSAPTSGDTAANVPSWWKIGDGGSYIITNTTATGNGAVTWGVTTVEPLFFANNASVDGFVTIVPNVAEPTAKFFAIAGISSNNGRALVDILKITVGGVDMSPSGRQQLYVDPGVGNVYNITIGMIPVLPNTPVRIDVRVNNNHGGSNGGKALLIVEN